MSISNWTKHRLVDVTHLIRRGPFGGAIKKEIFVDDGFKVYEQGNAIYDDFDKGRYFIDEWKYRELSGFAIQPNDLLVSCSGTIGRIAIVPQTARPGIINQALMLIRPNLERITPVFFRRLLESDDLQRKLFGLSNGSTMKNVMPLDEIKDTPVLVPPLSEQRRLAAIIDKADDIRRKREEGIRLTEKLLRSTFLEVFGDPTKQSLWEEKSLGEVVEIASGQVDPKEQPYASMPHVGGYNIESQTGEIRDAATAEELGLISGKYEFTPQDVLYSKIRPALNKVACPDFHGICSADIYPIRPNTGKMGRAYLASLLRSEDFLSFATKHSSRTNIPKINRPALLSYRFTLPPFSDQLRFEGAARRIREMKSHRMAACQVAETCFDSLVQRAFRGEL